MDIVRVLLVASSPLVRHGMASALNGGVGVEVAGEASELEEVIAAATELRPNVILLHLESSAVDGQTILRNMTEALPECKLIVVAEKDDEDGILAAVAAGAKGYGVQRHVWPEDLRAAISAVRRGYLWLCPASTQRLLCRAERRDDLLGERPVQHEGLLTPRELTVLHSISDGVTYTEIASTLYLSKNTIKTYVRRIMAKLRVRTRQEALVKAVSCGLLPDRRLASDHREEELVRAVGVD